LFLSSLSLANFRNYRQLDLQLPAPVVLFQGDNGQGKTNLLEAVYFLATTRSLRAGSDRELIHFAALEEPIPFARVEGKVKRRRGEAHVEIVIRADRPERRLPAIVDGTPPAELSKRVKLNGVARRAFDLIGQINVVTFSPQDLELVAGSPSVRRRFLDILNCQVDHRYCRTLSQYNRVLAQRNQLLKQIREGRQTQDMLEYWSEELVKAGSYLLHRRQRTVEALGRRIDGYFHRLTATGKTLKLTYHSSVEDATGRRGDTERERGSEGAKEREGSEPRTQDSERDSSLPQFSAPSTQRSSEDEAVEAQAELFRQALARSRRKEVLQGASLVGPHRDDLSFRADGIDMNVYGSRGEQRAVALALKLSEVEFIQEATEEQPILLLDDVMSELDPSRRGLLIEALDPSCQTLITATDLDSFSPEFLSRAALFRVSAGTATPMLGAEC
jgi:DNA replication and repair protein RecF